MKPKCILIVDDDQALRQTLAEYFGRCHQCMTCLARDAEEAQLHLRRRPFDLMLTDINHPGLNGLELTQFVHRHYGPPVIILTGWFSSESRRAAIASGARACLRKPFKLERLAEIVELVVGTGVHYIGEG
jgi:two-component system OmpR family response regulator